MNTPGIMQTLAWSLLHFLWQGAAIAALAAAVMYVFRKPATRYLIGVGALGFMLLSFVVTFMLLSSAAELPATPTAASTPAAAFVLPTETSRASTIAPWAGAPAATDAALDFAWVARAWLIGVCALALRIAFGLFVIEQLRRRNLVALPDALVARFEALQARLGISRGIRYAQCGLVNVPAVIGFFRPVVLIPMRALTGLSPEQLEALIAHELGHIKRFDVAVNFAQVIAETLFFFHPAVWWLNKRIRADREDCCDDIAVAAGGSKVGYAKALATIVDWTRQPRDVPSFAMAATGGPVAARVARLLGVNRDGASRTAGVFTASLVLAGALIAGAVSLGFVEPAQAQSAAASPANPASPVSPPNPPGRAAVPAAAAAPAAKPAPAARPAAAAKPAPGARPAPAPRPAPTVTASVNATVNATVENDVEAEVAAGNGTSYLDQMRSADLGEIGVEDLVALKVQDVTPDYIKGIRATGLNPSLNEIIAMKVQDVTPAYVREVRAMGFDVSTDSIIAFKVQDVTPEYVQQMRGMGFEVGADDIIGMKVQDVTPQYVQQMRELGIEFGSDEVIAMRVHDITPDYVKRMRAAGFPMTSANELISMKVHDVTPEYRRTLESAGFKLSVEQLVHAKVMDITPEFIGKAVSHGFKNLDIEQLIALKNADVL